MLVCLHCGSGMIATTREWVSRHGWTFRKRCVKCGRDKIEDTGSNSHDTSPLQTGEKIAKEARMSKSGICKFEGCTKKVLAGGYCYRHYKTVHGHPYKGGQKNHKGGNIEVPEKSNQQPIPLIQLFLYPELLDKLTKAAKAEWRTPEGQAAYLIEKALQEKADDNYQ